jgi:hypothetical protein
VTLLSILTLLCHHHHHLSPEVLSSSNTVSVPIKQPLPPSCPQSAAPSSCLFEAGTRSGQEKYQAADSLMFLLVNDNYRLKTCMDTSLTISYKDGQHTIIYRSKVFKTWNAQQWDINLIIVHSFSVPLPLDIFGILVPESPSDTKLCGCSSVLYNMVLYCI